MKKRVMTVELFSGIGGFRLAADAVGLRTVWANDIDSRACRVYRARFGGGKELVEGDIASLLDEVPEHDILSGGFPCQPFSSAGKKLGIRDPRGTLFQRIIEILESCRPTYFLLENVKRLLTMESGSHFATILKSLADSGYLVEWRLVSATYFGLPQNRQRILLAGTRLSELDSNEPVIKLASSSEFIGISNDLFSLVSRPRTWSRIESHGQRFPDWGIAFGGRFFCADPLRFNDAVLLPPLTSFLETNTGCDFDFTEITKERIKTSTFVNKFVNGVRILYNQAGGARMGYTVFGVDGIAPALTATASRHYERYKINGSYRRLTNVEYARLQGFADDHCSGISVYDQYELYGNAVPPTLARWGFQRLLTKGSPIEEFGIVEQNLLPFTYADAD